VGRNRPAREPLELNIVAGLVDPCRQFEGHRASGIQYFGRMKCRRGGFRTNIERRSVLRAQAGPAEGRGPQ
jgi:hypothetical protein